MKVGFLCTRCEVFWFCNRAASVWRGCSPRHFFICIDCALCRKPTSATWQRILQPGWSRRRRRTTSTTTVTGTPSPPPPRKSSCRFPQLTTLRCCKRMRHLISPASIQGLIFAPTVPSLDWLPTLWEKLLQWARGAQRLERNSSDWVKTEVELEGKNLCHSIPTTSKSNQSQGG